MVICSTDAFTKYAEIAAIDNKEAETVAQAIFDHWICRHGCPVLLLSDQGKEFCNQILDKVCLLMGITKKRTSPYHPQCNSQVEVKNKFIAKYLGDFSNSSTLDWEEFLPAMAFAYNTTMHRTIKATPFMLTYGIEHRTPVFAAQTTYGEVSPVN